MGFRHWPTALAILFACTQAWGADKCVGLSEMQKYVESKDAARTVDVTCSSLTTVMAKLLGRTRTSGRKLEDERPLDRHEAEANLDAALRDPETRRRLDQVRRDVNDGTVRLIYEAAILDEEGYYAARDLRIQQLSTSR